MLPAVEVTGLMKEYQIYNHPAGRLMAILGRPSRHSSHRVLDDITLTLNPGETVGIIGRNGAGKSTLLKIIAGVLDYDSGVKRVRGRIAALLELGIGFNPERTGRENVVFGGMCLGMTRAEVMEKMDRIIDFAELEDVIDQPFRTYSSGMQMRLAFSTAINVAADILIIDEALAVGDVLFQAKCFDKIRELQEQGMTILFVSHSMALIQQVCSRAVLLEGGRIESEGDPAAVGYAYEQIISKIRSRKLGLELEAQLTIGAETVADTDFSAEVTSLELLDSGGRSVATLKYGENYVLRVNVKSNADIGRISIGCRVEMPSGLAVFGTGTIYHGHELVLKAGQSVSAEFKFTNLLANGEYFAGSAISHFEDDGWVAIHTRRRAVQFQVHGGEKFSGVVDMITEVRLRS